MLTRFFNIFSQWVSWLAVVLDTSHKLFPGRLAYTHELNTIEITQFDGNHLLIGEGEYGQVYAVKQKPINMRRKSSAQKTREELIDSVG